MTTRAPEVPASTDDTERLPQRRLRWGEVVMTALLLGIGIYLILGAGRITIPGSANTVGPRFFPYLVGGATVVVAVLLGLRILRGDQGPDEGGEDIDPTAPTSWRAVGIISVAFLAHALLINVVGWPLAVTSMFGVVAWALGPGASSGRSWPGASPRWSSGCSSSRRWVWCCPAAFCSSWRRAGSERSSWKRSTSSPSVSPRR
jgi:hypothetical protein